MIRSHKHKTIGLRGVLILLAAAGACFASMSIIFRPDSQHTASAYPAGCVSQACREAADRAASSEAAAEAAAANAETLEGEIARLASEIASLEAEIAMNQAHAADLAQQIHDNEAKLTLQQAALAKLLVDLHFDTAPDAITLLASSSSIGDLAEKQTRQDTAKDQVTASAEAVKSLKQQLEQEKSSVDALIASGEQARAEISARQARQDALRAQYESDSEAYTRDAEAARETMQREIAEEIARYNVSGTVSSGTNTYPWAANCPADNVAYLVVGGYVCQCTSYAGWKAKEFYGIHIQSWGDAKSWGSTASRLGYVVDDNPAPHTIAYTTAGIYGHVMWVESVNSDGTINLTEYNNMTSSASHLAGDFGARSGVNPSMYRYIHLDQRKW